MVSEITGRHSRSVDSDVTEGVITTQSNRMKFRLSNALTFSSDESSKDVQLSDEEFSRILMKYSKNLRIGHININRVASFNFFELRSLILKSLFDLIVINNKCKMDHSFPDSHF